MDNKSLNIKSYVKKLASLVGFTALLLFSACSSDTLDSYDATPALYNFSVVIDENTTVGTNIGKITSFYNGGSAITSFTLTGDDKEAFSIANNGDVTTNVIFNATVKDKYNLNVYATNKVGNSDIESFEVTINPTEKEGKLVDSAIGGVSYETNTGKTGVTYSEGKFSYNTLDSTITFKLGSLMIVKDFNLSNINSDGIILPVDIVNYVATKDGEAQLDRNNTSDPRVIKFLRVLQSLDNDNDPSNGIYINGNTKGYLGILSTDRNIVSDNIDTLKTMVEGAEKTFKSQRKAREHYITTLRTMAILPPQKPFITVWETNDDGSITIPTYPDYPNYNYTVDWGDGYIDKNVTGAKTHTYDTNGNHTIKINGVFPYIYFKDNKKIQMITQWGDIVLEHLFSSFENCSNMDVNATDVPDLNSVTNMGLMFKNATNLKGNRYFEDWNVSNITKMLSMFNKASAFKNHDLSKWDVRNVTTSHDYFMTDAGTGNTEPNWSE